MTKAEVIIGKGTISQTKGVNVNIIQMTEESLRKETYHMTDEEIRTHMI